MNRTGVLAAAILAMAPMVAFANSTDALGGGQPFSTIQPSLGVNYLIRTQGLYPTAGGSPVGTLGEITLFAGNFAPDGYSIADGHLLSISQNAALFSLLGTTYGGDGKTTFALPDLRGRTAIGAGTGPGLAPIGLGEQVGTNLVTLSVDNLPPHNHTLPFPLQGVTSTVGKGTPYQNMQPSLGINYIVPLQGIYPSQNGGAFVGPDPVLGFVYATAAGYLPDGWTTASGQLLQVGDNTALYSLLGATFGGDGANTFALPDLRGRAPVGAGTGPGLTPRQLGQPMGTPTSTLLYGQMPVHEHFVQEVGNISGTAGGNQLQDTMQPGLGLHYIIATDGIYPSQSTGATSEEPLVGQIELFAGTFAPSGWMFCDGQLLPIQGHQALFSLLGNQFGGNARTNFALPNLDGRIAVGAADGPGIMPWLIGEDLGSELIGFTQSVMPSHAHTFFVPEPTSLGMLTLGAAALCMRRRRKTAAISGQN